MIRVMSIAALDDGLTVGQVAEQSGVAASAVRFYERQGLITSRRTSGNQRRYGPDIPCRIKMIRVAQRIGMSVAEIGAALALIPEHPGAADWERLGQYLRAELVRRIGELQQVLAEFSGDGKLCELPAVDRR